VARGHTLTAGGFGYVTSVTRLVAFGSGDIYSTPTDLVRWFVALARGHVIANDLFSLMATPFVLKSGKPSSYGLGMFVGQFGGFRELSQDGNSAGFSAQAAYYPEQDCCVAVLTNGSAHDAEGVEKAITRSILSIPELVTLDLQVSGHDLIDHVGDYRIGVTPIRIWADSGSLFVSKSNGRAERLLYQGSGVFAEAAAPDVRIQFDVDTATVSRSGKTLAVLERERSSGEARS
jgi:CubicO group peptidase (beta-lactamase class C family)